MRDEYIVTDVAARRPARCARRRRDVAARARARARTYASARAPARAYASACAPAPAPAPRPRAADAGKSLLQFYSILEHSIHSSPSFIKLLLCLSISLWIVFQGH